MMRDSKYNIMILVFMGMLSTGMDYSTLGTIIYPVTWDLLYS